jgi:uracil-DNA glycosylase family 4
MLTDCYVTAVARCAPPANRLLKEEIENCRHYLIEELRLMKNLRVIIALGKVAFDEIICCLKILNIKYERRRPVFTHGGYYVMSNGLILMVSFHPSQQNTFTGKLTQRMFHNVFRRSNTVLHSNGIFH